MVEQIKKTLRDKALARWIMMLLVSLLMAANYFFYDVLSPLKSLMQEKMGISSGDYGLIVGFYAFPNTFLLMAILGGIILDKLGIRPTGLLFAIFMLIGASLTAYGASDIYRSGGIGYHFMGSFWSGTSPEVKMMSLGMLIFGLGAETSIVVISKILVKWFKGYEIALAFAINLGIARLGTAMAFVLPPRLVRPDFWTLPIWFGVMLLLIGFVAFLIYVMYDIRIDRQTKADASLISVDEEFHIRDLGKLFTNRSFLFITALCVTFYAAVFPFLKYAPDFFYNKFNVSRETSGDIASLLPFGTIIFTPIFGALVDKKGKSATFMIFGASMLIAVHMLFTFTNIHWNVNLHLFGKDFGIDNMYIMLLMVVLGIAFSLVPAAMWPSVAKIVPESRIGTAYGAMFSLQNLGLFAVPILAGYILDAANPGVSSEMIEQGARLTYTPTMLLFIGFAIIGLIFAFLLKWDDKTSGYGLEYPSNHVMEEKKEAENE